MRPTLITPISLLNPGLVCLLALASADLVMAGDGVIEISATCAVQTGCVAGDTVGYPVTLSQPGSYRLTSNLVQPNAATSVINALANDIAIDLGGFEISGPFSSRVRLSSRSRGVGKWARRTRGNRARFIQASSILCND